MRKLFAIFFLTVYLFQLSYTLGAGIFYSQTDGSEMSLLVSLPGSEESESSGQNFEESEFCHRSSYLDCSATVLATSVIINFPLEDAFLRQSFTEIQTPPPEIA